MSLLTMAAQLFISKLGGSGAQLEEGGVVNALQQLLPTEGGELDLGALVTKFTSGGGLASLPAPGWAAVKTLNFLPPAFSRCWAAARWPTLPASWDWSRTPPPTAWHR